jgi:hypothetical protein
MDPDIKRMVTAHMLGITETLNQTAAVPHSPQPIDISLLAGEHENIIATEAKTTALHSPSSVAYPSVSDFEDCPRGTKLRILRRALAGEEVAKLAELDESGLTRLYAERVAA